MAEGYSGTAHRDVNGDWTIVVDGADETRAVAHLAPQLEALGADGEHVIVTVTEGGIERVVLG